VSAASRVSRTSTVAQGKPSNAELLATLSASPSTPAAVQNPPRSFSAPPKPQTKAPSSSSGQLARAALVIGAILFFLWMQSL